MQDVNVFSRLVKKTRIITMLLFIGVIFSLPNLVGCGSKSSMDIQEGVRSGGPDFLYSPDSSRAIICLFSSIFSELEEDTIVRCSLT